MEEKITIGIQGSRGSFNEQACLLYTEEHDIKSYHIQYLYTAEKVFSRLNAGMVDFGVFAITNNISGIILETLEALSQYNCHILDVFDMPVHYYLLAKHGKRIDDIEVVLSHPAILEGCHETLARNYSNKKLSSGEGILIDQSAAAAYLAEIGSPQFVAVIAPKICAELFDLDILDENIEDRESSTTFVWCKKR
jgi:prephenate dehydratase